MVNAPDHQWTHTLQLTTDPPANPPAFTDDPLVPRVTVVRSVHLRELRERIGALRARYRLPVFAWSDPELTTGSTRIQAVHLVELRGALADVFTAAGRPQPVYSSPTIPPGTIVTASQVAEVRAAVTGLW